MDDSANGFSDFNTPDRRGASACGDSGALGCVPLVSTPPLSPASAMVLASCIDPDSAQRLMLLSWCTAFVLLSQSIVPSVPPVPASAAQPSELMTGGARAPPPARKLSAPRRDTSRVSSSGPRNMHTVGAIASPGRGASVRGKEAGDVLAIACWVSVSSGAAAGRASTSVIFACSAHHWAAPVVTSPVKHTDVDNDARFAEACAVAPAGGGVGPSVATFAWLRSSSNRACASAIAASCAATTAFCVLTPSVSVSITEKASRPTSQSARELPDTRRARPGERSFSGTPAALSASSEDEYADATAL